MKITFPSALVDQLQMQLLVANKQEQQQTVTVGKKKKNT